MQDLAEQIQALVAAGDKIAAIKLLREATGVGLAQAKEAVEALAEGKPLPPFERAAADLDPASAELPADVRAAAEGGDRIQAIRLLRERRGLGLKEAKDQLDRAMPGPGKLGCLPALLFGLTLGGLGWWGH